MIDPKTIEIIMNLYFFLLGAFGFYLLIREIAFIRKESKKKKLEKEKMNNACNHRF